MNFNAMVPELTVSNIAQTKAFYLGKLGFRLEYERAEEKFLFASYEGSQFMFEQFHADGWNVGELSYPYGRGVNFSIASSNLEALYALVLKHRIEPYRALRETAYSCDGKEEIQKEFLIQDPDGYLLRFTERDER